MNVEIITKSDLRVLEDRLDKLLTAVSQRHVKGLGLVYNTRELAEKLKVSTKTINNWREARLIEYAKVQNTILFTEQAVLDFLANHSIKRKSKAI